MFMAYFSDLFRHRFVFIMIAIATSLSGFAVMLSPLSFNIKYGGLFLIAAGTYTAMPLIGESPSCTESRALSNKCSVLV